MSVPVPSRACLMCGTTYDACTTRLQETALRSKKGEPCCALCGDGDTHPAAERDRELTCAQWGALHGAPTKPKSEDSEADVAKLREKLRKGEQ